MRGELDIQKYSHPLGEGLFADNIILSILDYRETKSLDSKQKDTLERAKKFFDDVINGENLKSSILRSADDVKAAKAFDSVNSIRVGLPRSQSFIDHIRELRNTIVDILDDNPISEEKMDRLDNFYSNYSRIHFQKAKSVLETV